MHIEEVRIRKAILSDSQDILRWRNDPHSVAMFRNASLIEPSEHHAWYINVLRDDNITIYIGEVHAKPIGVCRFEKNITDTAASVAINLAPTSRGKGLGLQLLIESCSKFLADHPIALTAVVKEDNIASISIFRSAGFMQTGEGGGLLSFEKKTNQIFFKEVESSDSRLLYRLLSKRTCSISHQKMPTYENHLAFVCSNPYRFWYLVYDLVPIGSFYVQSDNSIGLNLVTYEKRHVAAIIEFIVNELTAHPPAPSLVAENFFFNVAYHNNTLRRYLEELGLNPIQISYSVKK